MSVVLALALVLGVAPGAEAKARKILAVPRFEVPENIAGPQPSPGSATITGRLVIRGCFTQVIPPIFDRKVKCRGAVVRACTEGRVVRARGPGVPAQFVTTGEGGSIAATVPYPVQGGYQEQSLSVPTETRRAKGFKISCSGGSTSVAIDSPETS